MIHRPVLVGLVAVLVGCAGSTTRLAPGTPNELDGRTAPKSYPLAISAEGGNEALAAAMPALARQLLVDHSDPDPIRLLADRMRLYLVAGEPIEALRAFQNLRAHPAAPSAGAAPGLSVQGTYAEALRRTGDGVADFGEAYGQAFTDTFAKINDRQAFQIAWYLETPAFVFDRQLSDALARAGDTGRLGRDEAMAVIRAWLARRVAAEVAAHVPGLLAAEEARRYVADDVLIHTPEGATFSAIVVRPRAAQGPQPTALLFTIYTDATANRQLARTAASYGYVGMVADTRGKGLSPDEIRPYEHEVDDVPAVIDWVSRQPWSNGEVGMYGGSYSGFSAWAATKRRHPALKTIVPYVAALPGQGLPMTNNVFLNANYGWAFYVSNNRTLDEATYRDGERWEALSQNWYASGRSYREIDQVDGTPNPLLQRWLEHPLYDAYWQAMVPYRQDFAEIDIPVLTITGYYDDGQISSLQYLRDHYRYRPNANHYLVIGPYDHFGSQSSRKPRELRGYDLDPVAQFDTEELTFQWLDHVLRGGERPALLQDRINYQVMGANSWRHADSLETMAGERLRLYLSSEPEGAFHRLLPDLPETPAARVQVVDLADRSRVHNDYYPNPIHGRDANFPTGVVFVSQPIKEPVEVSGMFGGRLMVTTNKRDFDFGVVLYEQLPDGSLFHLSYYLGRASHAEPEVRRLLVPGERTAIPFDRTNLVSRRIAAGSRLLVVVDVNKNPWHQINYGTGGDVSDESIADSGAPLQVHWHNSSYVEVPIRRDE